jgi:hypothetical protein
MAGGRAIVDDDRTAMVERTSNSDFTDVFSCWFGCSGHGKHSTHVVDRGPIEPRMID